METDLFMETDLKFPFSSRFFNFCCPLILPSFPWLLSPIHFISCFVCFPYFPKVPLVDFVYFMFLIYLKIFVVILYTDDGSEELGPKRLDFVEFGSVIK